MSGSCSSDTITIAARGNCKIDYCSCGTFSATIGPVTVRLEMAAARLLCATLAEAITEVGQMQVASKPGLMVVPDVEPII